MCRPGTTTTASVRPGTGPWVLAGWTWIGRCLPPFVLRHKSYRDFAGLLNMLNPRLYTGVQGNTQLQLYPIPDAMCRSTQLMWNLARIEAAFRVVARGLCG